jgi:hypothetical protein
MSAPLDLHLGLVRLSAELCNMQRAVQEVLNCSGLFSGAAGPDDLVAKAQYLALEAAIRRQEELADRSQRLTLKQDDRSMLLRIAYPSGQRIGHDDLRRVLDAAAPSPDASPSTSDTQTVARR